MNRTYGSRLRETLECRARQREQFSHLKRQIAESKAETKRIKARAVDDIYQAESRAFQKYSAMQPELSCALDRIVHEMGNALGSELKPYAEKLLQSARNFRLEWSSYTEPSTGTEIIRAEIPRLAFQFCVNRR